MSAVVLYPDISRNYCIFDENRINKLIVTEDEPIRAIGDKLVATQSEEEVLECLYSLNLMLDTGVEPQKVAEIYPILAKYNNTNSPNIQTFLAGIYRKIKVPDAFGPLCAMLIRNAINPQNNALFDPNEEIGGAILDYLA